MNTLIIAARVKKEKRRRGGITFSLSTSQLERPFLLLTCLLFPKSFSDQSGGSHLLSP